MLTSFSAITKNFKFQPKEYTIDNWIFKLHYRGTVLALLVATVLVTSRQYVGEHIKCVSDKGIPEAVMNTYCFFTSTFTVVKYLNASLLDSGYIAHPGVGSYGIDTNEPIKRHAYYQWVPFVLFGQAVMFYLTHLLWKCLEGGRLKALIDGLKLAAFALEEKGYSIGGKTIPSRDEKEKKMRYVRDTFLKRIYINKYWSAKLIFCEVLNIFHIIFQVYLTNKFLSGNFYKLGYEIWKDGLDSSVDVLDEVFPKVTKCIFHKYGPSGLIQHYDALCIMALNVVNDKIFTLLWFWYVCLFICTCLGLLWRALSFYLHARSSGFNRMVLANAYPGKVSPWSMATVTRYCNFTDWLFLIYLAKNLDGMVFKQMFLGLADDLEDHKPLYSESLIKNNEGKTSY